MQMKNYWLYVEPGNLTPKAYVQVVDSEQQEGRSGRDVHQLAAQLGVGARDRCCRRDETYGGQNIERNIGRRGLLLLCGCSVFE
jgi:hypothetical protein